MKKILQLYRLNFENRVLVLKYLIKRVLHLKTTEKERLLNEYYFHLINFNGFLKQENVNNYVSHYPSLDITIMLRKRPSSDMDVFSQIYQYLEYKPVVEVYKKYFSRDKELNIIDAGSNVGLTSVYLSKFFAKSTYVTIEPDRSNFENMTYNLEINKVENVQTIQGGLWSKNANLKIVHDFRDKNDWSIRVDETEDVSDLKAFSIPFLVNKYQFDTIDILKIDIEGSEKEVFTSLNSDVSFLSITRCIAIEIHDEFDCRKEIDEILRRYNFSCFESGELTIGINQNLI